MRYFPPGWIGLCSRGVWSWLNFLCGDRLYHHRKVFAPQSESQSVSFFLLGSDVAYYSALCDLDVLGNLMLVDEECFFCYIFISDSLE